MHKREEGINLNLKNIIQKYKFLDIHGVCLKYAISNPYIVFLA